ncbi:hypothetical protein GLYMA_04G240950v4 [Glycine max]|nr:hypothetical protein GLYMA_04G240950v4 [Glycine max]KAH1112975.1 hypothetical protein GYH30_010940 [Glycine max]
MRVLVLLLLMLCVQSLQQQSYGNINTHPSYQRSP